MTFFQIINKEKPVLVDFFATWCGPCKVMSPALKEVKDHFGDKISVVKIDVDKNPEVASDYQVRGVPTFILFRKGESLWRQSGVLPADSLVKVIENYINA